MRRLLLVVAVVIGVLVLTPSPSWACSCAMATTSQHVKQAKTVASGTVDWTATDGQTRTYKIDVDAVYKGTAAISEKLRTGASGAACGVAHLATDKRYIFFIDGVHPGTMRISLCGGTIAYDGAVAHQIESVTGPPGKPLTVTDEESVDTADHSSRNLVLGVGALALFLLVAGSIAVRRRP